MEGDDADALFVWRRERRDFEDRVESDREAVAWAEAKAAEAVAAEANKAADAAYAAAEKQAKADEKLVREIDELARKLAAKRDELAASIARTEAVNAARGDRPFIVDAEARVRQHPGRTEPAEFRDEVVWTDAAGNRPSVFRERDGQLEPTEAGFTRRTERVCVRQERIIPATMPIRFADAIELVDIDGRPL